MRRLSIIESKMADVVEFFARVSNAKLWKDMIKLQDIVERVFCFFWNSFHAKFQRKENVGGLWPHSPATCKISGIRWNTHWIFRASWSRDILSIKEHCFFTVLHWPNRVSKFPWEPLLTGRGRLPITGIEKAAYKAALLWELIGNLREIDRASISWPKFMAKSW